MKKITKERYDNDEKKPTYAVHSVSVVHAHALEHVALIRRASDCRLVGIYRHVRDDQVLDIRLDLSSSPSYANSLYFKLCGKNRPCETVKGLTCIDGGSLEWLFHLRI